MEDYAIVIEYLPEGHSSDPKREPLVQLVGTMQFTLLEATVLPEASIVLGQKVFVGKEGRKEIHRIKGRIKYDQLTSSAKDFLPTALKKIVEERESFFVNFINKAKPISMRVHTLELFPGIGKKNLEQILEEREKKPFESFGDIKSRVPTIGDPVMLFVNRIISELQGKEKYYFFVRPPFKPHFHHRRHW